MPRRVKGPDGIIHEFPDDATDHEISEALDAHPEKPGRTWGDIAKDSLSAIGGTVGALVGGVPGAAAGGAAGEGYRQLAEHATEIPGAIADVARNLVAQPAATLRGAVSGSATGAKDAAIDAGEQGAAEFVGGKIAQGASALGGAVYRGYLKPSLSAANIVKAREIVETGIREWLPVTQAGEARASRIIGQLNGQVQKVLKASGESVDLHQIAEQVRDFAKRTYQRAGSPPQDFEAAMRVADEIDKHPSLGLPAGANPTRVDVPVAHGNEVKQALDRAVGDTGFGVERNAATEARKVGRHAAREAIEAKVPGVGPLNEREAKVIDALESVSRAAGREENKNPLTGVSTILASGAGSLSYAHNGDPTMALLSALAARGLVTPAIASRAAILAVKLAESTYGKRFPAAAIRTGLVLALREDDKVQNSSDSKQ